MNVCHLASETRAGGLHRPAWQLECGSGEQEDWGFLTSPGTRLAGGGTRLHIPAGISDNFCLAYECHTDSGAWGVSYEACIRKGNDNDDKIIHSRISTLKPKI